MKICKLCHEEKELNFFYKNFGGKQGTRAVCILCEEYKRKTIYKQITKEKQREYTKKYLSNPINRDKAKQATNSWRLNNLAYDAFRARTYRARRQNQVPAWANLEQIKQIYLNCPKGFHVDHIIPLKGTKASGLHTEMNLQYLLAKENLQKRNLYGW